MVLQPRKAQGFRLVPGEDGLHVGRRQECQPKQFTVLVQVGNNDSTNDVSGTSVWLGIQPSGFGPVLISSPSPASQNIPPSGTAFFTLAF